MKDIKIGDEVYSNNWIDGIHGKVIEINGNNIKVELPVPIKFVMGTLNDFYKKSI